MTTQTYNTDPVEKLYNVVKSKGLYKKSLEEFKTKYSTPESVDFLYNTINSKKLYTKTKDDFVMQYFPTLKKKESGGIPSPTQSGSAAPLQLDAESISNIKSLVTGKPVEEIKANKQANMKLPTTVAPALTQVKSQTPSDASVREEAERKINSISDDDMADPIKGINKLSQANPTNPKDIIATEKAKNILVDRMAADGFDAKQLLRRSFFGGTGEDNQTARELRAKEKKYDNAVAPLRDLPVVGDLSQANELFLDMNYKDKIYAAAIQSYAEKNPSFKKELAVTGINPADWVNVRNQIPNGKLGQIMEEYLNDEDVYSFLQKENPALIPAFQHIQNTLLKDNNDYAINVVANKVSKAVQNTGFNNIDPVFNFYGDNHKEFADQMAQQVLSPEELEVWNRDIRDNQEKYMDAPSLFQGIAEGGEGVFKGIGNTFTEPFRSASESTKRRWEKEASHVSADPKGVFKVMRDTGHVLGLVGAIAGTGNVMGGGGASVYSSKVVPALSGGVLPFMGDMLEQGRAKYPDSPVKAWTSALVNTSMYAALSQSIFPSKSINQAIGRVSPEVNGIVERLANGSITREAARQQANTAFKKAFDFAKGTVGKAAKITGELEAIKAFDRGLDKIMMDEESFEKFHPEEGRGEEAIGLFLSNLALGAFTKFGDMKKRNRIAEESYYELASNPKKYERMIDNLSVEKSFGTINEFKENLKHIATVKAELDGLKIAPKDQKRFIFESLKEKAAKEQAEISTDATIQQKSKEIIKQAKEVKEKILKGEDAETLVTESQQKEIDKQRETELKIERLTKDNEFDNKKFDKQREGLDGRNPEDKIKIEKIEEDRRRANEDFEIELKKLKPDPSLPGIYGEMYKENPEAVLKDIAEQAQGIDKDGNPLEGGSRREDMIKQGFSKEIIDEAVKKYPMQKPEGAAGDVVPSTLKDQNITTDRAEMEGEFTDKVEINDEVVALPESGYVISGVNLKEGQEKGKGAGQEIYKKALDEHGVLYSFFPISEDALRVHDKLAEKGVATIEHITLPDGNEARKITAIKSQQQSTPTKGNVVPSTLKEEVISEEDFLKANPHSGGALTGKPSEFDKLPEDSEVWVFTATTPNNAKNIIEGKDGYEPELQGQNIKGETTDIYVASDPRVVSGMGKTIVAFKVKKSDLALSPEAQKSNQTLGRAVISSATGAILKGNPIESRIVENQSKYHESSKTAYESLYPKSQQQSTPTNEGKPKVRVTAEQMEAAQPKEPPSPPSGSEPPPPEQPKGSKGVHSEQPEMSFKKDNFVRARNRVGIDEFVDEGKTTHLQETTKALRTIYEWKEDGTYSTKMADIQDRAAKGQISNQEKFIFAKHLADLDATVNSIKDVTSKEYDRALQEYTKALDAADAARSEAARQLGMVAKNKGEPQSLADAMVEEKNITKTDVLTDKQKETVQREFKEEQEAQKKWNDKKQKLEEDRDNRKAQKTIDEIVKNKKSGEKKNYAERRAKLREQLKAAKEEHDKWLKEQGIQKQGFGSLTGKEAKIILEIAKEYVEEGAVKLADAVKKTLDEIKDILPDVTERDVRDVLAGKYAEKKPTRSDLAIAMQDLKTEQNLLDKLEQLEKGEIPKSEKRKRRRNKAITELENKIKDIRSKDAEDRRKAIEEDRKIKQQKLEAQREAKRLEREFEKEQRASEKARIKAQIAETKRIERELSKKTPLDIYKDKMRSQMDKIQEQIRKGDFATPEKPEPLQLDAEARKIKDDLIKIRNEKKLRQLREFYKNQSDADKAYRVFVEILNVPRSLMASMDFSALLRQAIIPTVSRPRTALRVDGTKQGLNKLQGSIPEMFRGAKSEAYYERWMNDLSEAADYPDMIKFKLGITDANNPSFKAHEELFMSNLAEKIPLLGTIGVKGSQRAYTIALNKIRVDMYRQFASSLRDRGMTPENAPEMYKHVADYINNATGRGNIHRVLEKAAPILSGLFFSPKLIASRINMVTFLAQLPFKKNVPKEIIRAYMADVAKFMAVGLSIMALAKYGLGAEVEDDPRSSDFGKIKDGNTRWDIWGGFQQYARVIAQVWTGERKSTNTGEIQVLDGDGRFGHNRSDVASKFIRAKLAPVPAMVVDLSSGRNIVGEEIKLGQFKGDLVNPDDRSGKPSVGAGEYAAQHFLPLNLTGLIDSWKDRGARSMLDVLIPATFGVGVQTYEPKKSTGRRNRRNPKKPTKSD
ncbi:MAG TPA: hypothetical protein PKV73_01065 [Agriterribacter sp.]|nr:hypothetical protein [Agriterribacter sp.]